MLTVSWLNRPLLVSTDRANNSIDTGAEKPPGLKSGHIPPLLGTAKTLTQGTLCLLVFHKDQHKRHCLESLLAGKRHCVSLHSNTELEGNSQLWAGAFQSSTDIQKGLRTREEQHCTYRTKTKPLLGWGAPFLSGENIALPLLPFLEKKNPNQTKTKKWSCCFQIYCKVDADQLGHPLGSSLRKLVLVVDGTVDLAAEKGMML